MGKARIGERAANVVTFAAATAAILLAAGMVLNRPAPRERAAAEVHVENWTDIASAGHRVGSDTPRAVLVEFGDYQCRACRRTYPHLQAVLRQFPEVALVYRHWPLSYNQFALPAARAAECAAAQDRFWQMHHLLYTDDNWLGDAMRRFAEESDIPDIESFMHCLASTDVDSIIEQDRAVAQGLGANGTPALLLNGLLIQAGFDSVALSRRIEAILK